MEKISKNENLHNEQCNMCLEFNNKYVIFSCKHKICFKCFYKILLRKYIKDISINKEIKINCVCNKGDLKKDLDSIYNNINDLFKNDFYEKNGKSEIRCNKHPNNLIIDFCIDCMEYTCEKCKEVNGIHYEHNLQNVNDYSKEIKEKINKLPDISNFLEEYENKLKNYFNDFSKDISSKIDYLINEIQRYKKDCLEIIKNKIDKKILPMKICLLLYKYYNYEIEKNSKDIHLLLFLLNTKIIIPEINYQINRTENDIENVIKSVNNLNLDKRVIVKLNEKYCNFRNFQNIENAHKININCLVKISGNKLVSGDLDGNIKIWKISGKGIFNIQSEKAHENQIQSIIGLNNKIFSSCSNFESFVFIWKENDKNNFFHISQKIDLLSKICLTLNKLNDNKTLLVVLNDNNIYSYKNKNNEYIQDNIIGSYEGKINCLIQLKNNLIVTGSDDNKIIIWNKRKKESILTEHKDSINIIIELDNEKICSGSSDKKIIIWQKNKLKYEKDLILEGHLDGIKSLCFLQDKRIISGSFDCTIKIWLLSRNGYICYNTINEHNSTISGLIGFNDDIFISSSYDKSIKVWIVNNN